MQSDNISKTLLDSVFTGLIFFTGNIFWAISCVLESTPFWFSIVGLTSFTSGDGLFNSGNGKVGATDLFSASARRCFDNFDKNLKTKLLLLKITNYFKLKLRITHIS